MALCSLLRGRIVSRIFGKDTLEQRGRGKGRDEGLGRKRVLCFHPNFQGFGLLHRLIVFLEQIRELLFIVPL